MLKKIIFSMGEDDVFLFKVMAHKSFETGNDLAGPRRRQDQFKIDFKIAVRTGL